jgi:hypothetical protein
MFDPGMATASMSSSARRTIQYSEKLEFINDPLVLLDTPPLGRPVEPGDDSFA